ncbi:MAG: ribbon-helix-helix protein, CopG family [Anaerolineaceae bacterium]|nr:ribbon-helix-helix protein, CopG family [Anaerolineaceae bacterium]
MIRTQIQLTEDQARLLKKLALKENKSMAELIRMSIDAMLLRGGYQNHDHLRKRALQAAGKLSGPIDLAANHDDYLSEDFNQ